jgi:hypothetical protein
VGNLGPPYCLGSFNDLATESHPTYGRRHAIFPLTRTIAGGLVAVARSTVCTGQGEVPNCLRFDSALKSEGK